MKQYHDLLSHILKHGKKREDRTGTGTVSVFGYQMRFDLAEGFPLVTTKKIHWKSVVHELLWFLSGSTNVRYLQENGVKIWNEWADEHGELGPVYGHQWRDFGKKYFNTSTREVLPLKWPKKAGPQKELSQGNGYIHLEGVDQIKWLIDEIRRSPKSRRLVVSAWNPVDLPHMALPPCHCLFQFYVDDRKLSCQLYQRSGDAFLGVPFNIASYALLTHMVAHVTGLQVGEFIHTLGDAHLYLNHIEQAKLQLSREHRTLPSLHFKRTVTDIFDFKFEDVGLEGYDPHPSIKAEVSV